MTGNAPFKQQDAVLANSWKGHLLCLAVAYNVSLRRLVAQEFDCIFWFGTVEVAGGCDV